MCFQLQILLYNYRLDGFLSGMLLRDFVSRREVLARGDGMW